jgi:hypothetical protein
MLWNPRTVVQTSLERTGSLRSLRLIVPVFLVTMKRALFDASVCVSTKETSIVLDASLEF